MTTNFIDLLDFLIPATIIWFILIFVVYRYSGFDTIKLSYLLFFQKKYWTNYNIIEFISWSIKAIIIVPGLIFNIQIWWLYIIALCTSLSLIWASNKKTLPTLICFNTLWAWISCAVIVKNIYLM